MLSTPSPQSPLTASICRGRTSQGQRGQLHDNAQTCFLNVRNDPGILCSPGKHFQGPAGIPDLPFLPLTHGWPPFLSSLVATPSPGTKDTHPSCFKGTQAEPTRSKHGWSPRFGFNSHCSHPQPLSERLLDPPEASGFSFCILSLLVLPVIVTPAPVEAQ